MKQLNKALAKTALLVICCVPIYYLYVLVRIIVGDFQRAGWREVLEFVLHDSYASYSNDPNRFGIHEATGYGLMLTAIIIGVVVFLAIMYWLIDTLSGDEKEGKKTR